MLTVDDYHTERQPTWCPGCGNFGIWAAFKNALVELSLAPKDIVVIYGIGCHGNMYNALKANSFEGLHGRPLPIASGIKMVNPKLPVFAISGDGDALGEGGNHLIHACRRNYDITYLIHDNQVYGLTTGQTSPTSARGFKTKTNPDGAVDYALNPLALALSSGATFVARGFAGDIPDLTNLIKRAHLHKGFSVLDVLQPCITFNHVNSYQFYRQYGYKLDQNYNVRDKIKAFEKTLEWERTGKIPMGVFYEEEKPTYEDDLEQIKDKSLIEQPLIPENFTAFLTEFT